MESPFWKTKQLAEMTHAEWESLCDGCGQCCLHKYEDEDTGEIYHTRIACRLLDLQTCRCSHYARRKHIVPQCVVLRPEMVAALHWLPPTCAYRLVAEGKDLPDWHPLVSGDPETVHQAGISVRGRVISEKDADLDHWENYVVLPPANPNPTRIIDSRQDAKGAKKSKAAHAKPPRTPRKPSDHKEHKGHQG